MQQQSTAMKTSALAQSFLAWGTMTFAPINLWNAPHQNVSAGGK